MFDNPQILPLGLSRPHVFALLCSILLIFSASLYLASTRGLTETLEAESAEIAREFIEGASILINHLNGQEDLDKPPLFYWTIALISRVCPNWELAARLPSLISACLIIYLFFRLPYHGEYWMAAALSGFIFISGIKVFWMSQMARIDMSFTAASFFGLWAAYKAIMDSQGERTENPQKIPWAFFISAGVAVMLKGPVGAIIVFIPVFLYLAIEKRWRLIRHIFLGKGMLLFLLMTIPWFVTASIETDFRFFHRFILEENLSRFTNLIPGGTFKEFNHSPIYSYPIYFLTGFFPWSIAAPFWTYEIIKDWKNKDELSRLSFIYLLFVFLFFSMALSKRSDYILPVYPVASYLTVRYFLDSRDRLKPLKLIILLTFTILILTGLCLSLSASVVVFLAPTTWNTFLKDIPVSNSMLFFLYSLPKYLPAFLALLIIGFSGLFFYMKGNDGHEVENIVLPYALHMCCVFLLSSLVLIPALYKHKDARPFCHNVAKIVDSNPLFYLGFWDEECTFYLHRRIPRLHLAEFLEKTEAGERLFLILREKDFTRLPKKGISFPFVYRQDSPLLRPLVLVSNQAIQQDN